MANPFENNQDTTGGKAGFAAFKELQTDKAYDDETLKPNPGAPLPAPAGAVSEFLEARNNVTPPDYEGIQLQKFKDFKKTSEAMDDILEREYIDQINAKKQQIVNIMTTAKSAIPTVNPATNVRLITASRSKMSQTQLTNLVTEGTVYIDCWLTISDIEKIIKQSSEKAFYSEYQN